MSLFSASPTAQGERLAGLRQQMDNLSREVTTGQVSDTYSGLGTNADPVLNLNAQQPLLQSYLTNISSASNTMTLMNNALCRFPPSATSSSPPYRPSSRTRRRTYRISSR